MPLIKSASDDAFRTNVAEMIRSGRPRDQALAASYRNQRQHHAGGGGIAHRDYGGGLDPTAGPGIAAAPAALDPLSGGTAPNVANQTPGAQAAYQRYQNMPVEKLQELSVRLPASSHEGQTVRRVLQNKRMSPAQTQPVAGAGAGAAGAGIAPASGAGAPPPAYADGGMLGVPLSEASPWWTRAEERQSSTGYLHGNTLGRADNVTTTAPGGSHIIPADVMSGLGEGNSLAGAKVFDMMLKSGPWGVPIEHRSGGHGIPHVSPPAPYHDRGLQEQRHGGVHKGVGRHVPVKLSHGEFQCGPEWVLQIGRHFAGPHASEKTARNRGHRFLDMWLVHERKKIAKKMLALPGPVKS